VEKIGARYIESGKLPVGDLGKQIKNVDLIYEATGSAALAFAALPAIGKNGVFIFTGVPGHKTPVTLDAEPIMRDLVLENQLLYGTVNAGPPAFEASIRDLGKFNARWPGPVRELITGHFAPEQITDILSPDHGGIKNVIRFGTPLGVTTGAKAAAATAKGAARG
jgi:threonine dehydrogenase-like Zn-dependent dehydrogenase